MEKNEEERGHSVAQNVQYIWKAYKQEKYFTTKMIIVYLCTIMSIVLPMLLPALLVHYFEQKAAFSQLLLVIAVIISLLMATSYGATVMQLVFKADNHYATNDQLEREAHYKTYETSYENTLLTKFQQLQMNMLMYAVYGDNAAGANLIPNALNLAITITLMMGFTLYTTTLIPVFGLVVLAQVVLIYFTSQLEARKRNALSDMRDEATVRRNYVKRLAANLENAKDIRLFQQENWLLRNYQRAADDYVNYLRQIDRKAYLARLLEAGFQVLRDGLIFILLLHEIQQGLPIAQFVLTFTVLTQMNSWSMQIVTQYAKVKENSQDLEYVRRFLTFPETQKQQADTALPQQITEIRFEHVSYRYPNAKDDTLKDISFTFRMGERIALVGHNGAGKSTTVQLLLGLLQPTAGTIYVNDQPLSSFTQSQVSQIVTPIFQNTEVWAITIGQMVAMQIEDIDEERVWAALEKANIAEKIRAYPQGLATQMTHNLYADGIELSGGQTQRLMLARAFYQDTPILLLDEPTSALDALAESELYEEYHKLVENRLSVFISHRLASTRFCHQIYFFEQGELKEQGTHEELLARGGAYKKMYDIQRNYYQEEGK